jgi:hypothetical protein
MSKKAHVAHHIPGRMRIIIQAGRGNPALLDQTRSLLAEIPGIEKVVVKPDSGSILLHYEYEQAEAFEATLRRIIPAPTPPEAKTPLENRELPGNEFDVMTRELEAEAELIAARSHTAQVIVDFFKDFDHQVKRATNNAIDLKIVLALGLAIVTFLEIGAEAATPMWITLVLFALNHFLETHPPHPASDAAQRPTGLGGALAAA